VLGVASSAFFSVGWRSSFSGFIIAAPIITFTISLISCKRNEFEELLEGLKEDHANGVA